MDKLMNRHSYESALLMASESLRLIADEGKTAAQFMLDLSAAFGTVSHGLLSAVVIWCQGRAIVWLGDDLQNHTFQEQQHP